MTVKKHMANNNDLIEKIVSLCKRRGFVFPGSEIHGGLANSWDYGPLGVELKNNIKQLWWRRFVHMRDDMVGIDAALIMNPKVWEASGHVATFSDPLVECKKCHARFRSDHIQTYWKDENGFEQAKQIMEIGIDADSDEIFDSHKELLFWVCENCQQKNFGSEPKQFNLMFKTFIGPAEEAANVAYFRPETAQAMFVDFKNVLDTARKKLPFGIAQQGKAFRNEITPGNFIFRTREFEQMEIEYFFAPPKDESEWQKVFEEWRKEMVSWMRDDLKLDMSHVHELEVEKADLAHYSRRTIDFEYEYPFGKKELYGLAYRTDFDLKNHFKEEPYFDQESGEKFWPHCIEPTWGVDRTILAVLCEHYKEDGERVYLALPPKLAPYKVAVFPLLKNKPELVEKARGIYQALRAAGLNTAWDDRGNVGKRYYSQDEIGTPFCVTVDFDTLENDTVTIRNRDTAEQERVSVQEVQEYIKKAL